MLSLFARRAAVPALAIAMLVLTGCQTPLPAPTQLPMEQLEPRVAECGGAVPAVRDTSIPVEISVADAAGMRVTLEVAVLDGTPQSSHGEHELGNVDVRVVDAAGRVVGIEMANGWRERSGFEGMREVELGGCPGETGTVGAALPDGDYRLIVSGSLRPLDHAHVQSEVWLADPLAIAVTSGTISAS